MHEQESASVGEQRWQISIAGKLRGPLNTTELRLLAQAGKLTPYTLVRIEGTTEWRMLSAVPELAGLLTNPATPQVPSAKPVAPPRKNSPFTYLVVAAAIFVVGGYVAWQQGWISQKLWQRQRPAAEKGRNEVRPSLPATAVPQGPAVEQVSVQPPAPHPQGQGVGDTQEAPRANAEVSSATVVRVGEQAWAELSRQLTDPPRLGREKFHQLFTLCAQNGFPTGVREQPEYRLAQALNDYEQGERTRALASLGELAAANTETTITRVARQILSPPPAGRLETARPPITFKDGRGQVSLVIELKALEVGRREVELEMSIHNRSARRQFLSFAENASEPSADTSNALLALIDDNGQKQESVRGLGGGTLVAEASGNLRAVQFEPGEKRTIYASFPLPSPGATRVSFVSPRYRSQSSWGWKDLSIKAGPFDPPLATLPLHNTSLLHPADASDGKSAGTSGSTMATAQMTPAPAPKPTPASQPEAQGQEESDESKVVTAQGKPVAAPKAIPRAQTQATTARQTAERERDRCRSRLGQSALKKSLFESAEGQRRYAEEAFRAGDYAKAELYFKQAIDVYKRVSQ